MCRAPIGGCPWRNGQGVTVAGPGGGVRDGGVHANGGVWVVYAASDGHGTRRYIRAPARGLQLLLCSGHVAVSARERLCPHPHVCVLCIHGRPICAGCAARRCASARLTAPTSTPGVRQTLLGTLNELECNVCTDCTERPFAPAVVALCSRGIQQM